jgi:GlpG protein
MRELARYPEPQLAARLGDVLLAEGIDTTINTARDGQTVVWVRDDLHLERARTLLAEFQSQPDAPRFIEASRIAKERRSQQRKAEANRPPLIRARDRFLRPSSGVSGISPLAAALILMSVVVAVITQLGERADMVRLFSYASCRSDGDYLICDSLGGFLAGQFYRILTPIFIHYGAAHLLFNMWWLKDLGTMIERRQSAWFLALLVAAIGACSNTAQYWVSGPSFGGMSGVVYGLFGYIWMRGRFDPASGYAMSQRDIIWMMLWLVACYTGMVGPIANTAHTVGLAVGGLWGFFASGYLGRRLRRP